MAQESLEAPLAGKIMRIHVKAGDTVKEGDVVCTIESLKMENAILAPISGVVREVRVAPGQAIKAGEIMAIIEN